MGINQNRPIVDDRIAIVANTVLRRNFVIGNAGFRKHRSYPDIPFIAVRGPVLFFDDVMTEARTLIPAQNASHTPDDPSDRAAYNSADRTRSTLAFAGTSLDTSSHSL